MAASQQPPKDLNLNNLAVKDVLTVAQLTANNSTLGHTLINRATINTAVVNDLIWVNEPGFYSVSENASKVVPTNTTTNMGPAALFATYDEYNVVGSDISGEPNVDAAWTVNTTGIYEFQFNASTVLAASSTLTATYRINGVAQSEAGSVGNGAVAVTVPIVANVTYSLSAGDTIDIAFAASNTVISFSGRTMTIKRIV